ncbi:MAG: signal peptidase I [Phycisphaerales bacterium]|nr:signal peptidase I [Phycisphaerales bacterium]
MTPGRSRSAGPRIGRAIAAGAVALLVFHLLRTWVAERYLVPTESMEPTLHGDRERGDLVLVDKLGLVRSRAPGALRRFDLVVVKDPESAHEHLVKRVVSMGDEELAILDGDLFVRRLGEAGPFVRIQKHPLEHRDMRMTFFAYPSSSPASKHTSSRPPSGGEDPSEYLSFGAAEPGMIALPLGAAEPAELLRPYERERRRRASGGGPRGWQAPPSALRTTSPIDVSFLNAEGRRIAVGRGFDRDVGIEVTVALDDSLTGVCFALELRERMSDLSYTRDGRCMFHGASGAALELRGPPLTGERVEFTFGHLDGRVFFAVGDQLVVLAESPPVTDEPDDWPENVLHFGVAGAAGDAQVSGVRLFHDVYYRPDAVAFAEPRYRVEPDSLFLLGDNSSYSVDSRRRGAFPVRGLAGRPLAVIGPWQRVRWLPR